MSSQPEEVRHLGVPGEPKGNPGQIRAAAQQWKSVANELGGVRDALNARVRGISASWSGDAEGAFVDEWNRLSSAIADGVDNLGQLAASLDTLAGQLESAQRKYRAALIGTGITLVVGVGLTFLTFGVSDEVAAGTAAAEMGAATLAVEEAAATAASLFSSVISFATQIATRFVVNFAVTMGAEMAGNAIAYPDHNPFSHLDYQQALEAAAAGTAASYLVPGLAKLPGINSVPLGLATPALTGLTAAGISAGEQEALTGHIDPMSVLFAGATGVAGEAIVGGVGRGPSLAGEETLGLTAGGLDGSEMAGIQSTSEMTDLVGTYREAPTAVKTQLSERIGELGGLQYLKSETGISTLKLSPPRERPSVADVAEARARFERGEAWDQPITYGGSRAPNIVYFDGKTLHIIEAKGGNSRYGSRYSFARRSTILQTDPQYPYDVALDMLISPLQDGRQDLAVVIMRAYALGNVKYVSVRTGGGTSFASGQTPIRVEHVFYAPGDQ